MSDSRRWQFGVALVVTAAALLASGIHATYAARISVDEPQYLLTAISLGEDFDLNIADELADERYRPWHDAPLLSQTAELDTTGRQISPHDPLLPVLLAAPMRVGGWVAARITMAIFAGIAATMTVGLAVGHFAVQPRTAALVVGGFFLSPPLIAYGNQIYPAMPATIAVLTGLTVVLGDATKQWWVGVIAITALPWLAIKYVPLAAVLAVGLLWRLHSDRPTDPRSNRHPKTAIAATITALALAGFTYLAAHQALYGGWTVYATGDHFVESEWNVVGENINLVGRTRRLIGLLVDQQFGLAAWAPAYLAGPAALTIVARRGVARWPVMIALVAAGWAIATWVALTMHGWWWPGRQVVPILPIVVIAIARVVDRSRRLFNALMLASALAIVTWLWIVIEASTGRRALIVDFAETSNPLYQTWRLALPDHQTFALTSPALTVIWSALVIGSCAWAASRGTTGRRVLDG